MVRRPIAPKYFYTRMYASSLAKPFFFGCRLTTLGAHRFPLAWLRPQADGGRWGRSLSYGFPGRGRLTRGNVGLDPLRKISARGRPWSQVPCGRPGTTRISLGGHYEPGLDSGARCLGLWYGPERCARGSHRLAGPQTSRSRIYTGPLGLSTGSTTQVLWLRLVPRLAYLASRCRLGPGVSFDET